MGEDVSEKMSLRGKINNIEGELVRLFHENRSTDLYAEDEKRELARLVISVFEKTIDKVEQDYKNELNNWGKSQPMKDMYPREMNALERVRKELV